MDDLLQGKGQGGGESRGPDEDIADIESARGMVPLGYTCYGGRQQVRGWDT